MQAVPAPTVSVVVITRDRPQDVQICLRAILASTFTAYELVVVDQSAQSTSADFVAEQAARDARIRLIRDAGKGAARARNIGVAATTGEIVVFIDDDCEPGPEWLGTIVQAVSADPSVGIAYGTVLPAPHNPKDGFIVTFLPARRLRLTGRMAKLRDSGISANVALRRTALQATGGFDEMLGPGSYFPCAEDSDLTYRVLAQGFALLHVPGARLVHHGLRDWRSGSSLIRKTYIAIGAAYMKHLRLRDLMGLVLLTQEIYLALTNILINVGHGRRPIGFGRLTGLFVGMRRSFELGVDHCHAIYRRPG